MNKSLRAGKSSELIVAGELLRQGLDVYLPCVDDQAIDLLIRVETQVSVVHYDVQVKRVKGYNRIIGVKKPRGAGNRYILIIHYRHANKPDEFFYLTREQIALHHLADSAWGDLVSNRAEREFYARQTLVELAERVIQNNL